VLGKVLRQAARERKQEEEEVLSMEDFAERDSEDEEQGDVQLAPSSIFHGLFGGYVRWWTLCSNSIGSALVPVCVASWFA
jgi:hypothetical protein